MLCFGQAMKIVLVTHQCLSCWYLHPNTLLFQNILFLLCCVCPFRFYQLLFICWGILFTVWITFPYLGMLSVCTHRTESLTKTENSASSSSQNKISMWFFRRIRRFFFPFIIPFSLYTQKYIFKKNIVSTATYFLPFWNNTDL